MFTEDQFKHLQARARKANLFLYSPFRGKWSIYHRTAQKMLEVNSYTTAERVIKVFENITEEKPV
jgi:hypothetical protein